MTAKICQMYAQDRSQEGNPLKCYVQGSSYLYYHSNVESENMVWRLKKIKEDIMTQLITGLGNGRNTLNLIKI